MSDIKDDIEMQAGDQNGRKDLTRSETLAVLASHTPISVAWQNLNFKVITKGCGKKRPGKTLHILKDLSGCVLPGKMLAIIGGSGAGKSTLLDILVSSCFMSVFFSCDICFACPVWNC